MKFPSPACQKDEHEVEERAERMANDTENLFYRILRALLVQSGKMTKEGI